MVVHQFLLFFFFKQKTAYEIVSRDWSSDVCSSDLLRFIATMNLNGDYLSDALAAQVGGIGIAPGGNINYDTGQIGRASCRERV